MQSGIDSSSGGHIQSWASLRMKFFTILSSIEWYDITAILPEYPSNETACSSAVSNMRNSLFTAILIAWNV